MNTQEFYIGGKKHRRPARPAPKKHYAKPAGDPIVTDHAIVRYIERVRGVPVDKLRELILTDKAVEAINAGASGFIEDGIRYVIKDGAIVTVIPVKDEA